MRSPGLEPESAAWEAAIIPLDHKRTINVRTIKLIGARS
jgi:hypothetical protein